jgi:endonuclease/exonuclease/phosphatase family metal-dependent hydrolase
MRLATFNIENLDLGSKSEVPLETRIAILRPMLERLKADVVCLQEVNGQHVRGVTERRLVALDQLLQGTRYEAFTRAFTTGPQGSGVADVHNLVTLSRYPINSSMEIKHAKVQPLHHKFATGRLAGSEDPQHVVFERPLLLTQMTLPGGRPLDVINVHLRAPLASLIPGEKVGPFKWRNVSGWAEGYFIAGVKRTAQALELRLVLEDRLASDPQRLIAVAGDYNAEDHETPLRLVIAAEEDTGNGDLAARSMVVLDRAIAADRRWSVLHHGRPQMLDHILASRALYGHFDAIEVHNEALGDEAVGYAKSLAPTGSYHAPVVATFDLA